MKNKREKDGDWATLTQASRMTGYDKSTLSTLARKGEIRSKFNIIKKVVIQRHRVLEVNIPDVAKHREKAKPGPKGPRKKVTS